MSEETPSRLITILQDESKYNHISLLYNVVALIWILGQKKDQRKVLRELEMIAVLEHLQVDSPSDSLLFSTIIQALETLKKK